jgi:hypothetical protein
MPSSPKSPSVMKFSMTRLSSSRVPPTVNNRVKLGKPSSTTAPGPRVVIETATPAGMTIGGPAMRIVVASQSSTIVPPAATA